MTSNAHDIFDKCYAKSGNFTQHTESDDNYLLSPILQGNPGPHMRFQDQDMIVWTINDYLGLAQNEEIKQSALKSVQQWSTTSPMGARLMSGNTPAHVNLEKKLARMCHKEEATLYISGYLGVMGAITGLVGRNDTVIIDQYSHACMIDGAMLAQARSGVRIKPFKHNDMRDLERQLKLAREENEGGVLIVTEGVFGMRGDFANLPEICALKEKYEARLFVDDAHGLGVIGANGKGTGEYFNVQDEIDIYFSTFAKAFVSIGGFTAGPREVIDYLRLNARPSIYSKVHPLILIDAIDKATDLIEDGHARRKAMWDITSALQDGLRDMGYDIGVTKAPITPVYIKGDELDLTIKMLHMLRDEYHIFVTAVTAPVVPIGTTLFRLVPTAAHSMEDVSITLNAFKNMRDRLKLNY
ncbi:MAG TPA: pyridoxal phosphate-dependent aminotransferase family protein [Legionella sp.]|nr:pyridoxal phosphate-dependent aminotransferase family protein [Legionella sp.]